MSAYGEMAAGAGLNAVYGVVNNLLAMKREQMARRENYEYNELAAQNADTRTRALYADLQSPEALLQQYKDAGLSPSLMFGGGGIGGQTANGAQGEGASGIAPTTYGLSAMEAAQIGLINAQREKTEADTKNVNKDTELKSLDADYNLWRNYLKEQSFKLTTFRPRDENGNDISFYNLAENASSLNDFVEKTINIINEDDLKAYARTEEGMKELRNIYLAANVFERDIKVLSEEGVSAEFQKSIMNEMQRNGFAEQNAISAIRQLKAAAETASLTEEQKGAWNRLLERIGKKSETAKDVLIILSMLINNAATNWKMPTNIEEHHDVYYNN